MTPTEVEEGRSNLPDHEVQSGDAADAIAGLESRVEDFVRAQLPGEWVSAIDRGETSAVAALRDALDLEAWWVALAEAGFATPAWPIEFGGLGASPAEVAAVGRVLARYRVPRFTNPVGIDLVGPALLRWGSQEQKERYLRPIARHQEVWCQLFSEPGAGSDLAGLSTRATRDGDEWVVSGQKVWTSLAHLAAFGLLLARTDPTLPKHRGITMFLVPMESAGVIVRPLRHMAGEVEFNEVFLDEVRVHDGLRLGDVNQGWSVAISVLLNERQAMAGTANTLPGNKIGRSVDALIRRHSPLPPGELRTRLTQAYVEETLMQVTSRRAAARRRAGLGAGPEGSITKLFYSEHVKRLQALACDLEGGAGQAWEHDDRWRANTAWALMRIQSKTIAGGTSEIQRNILGERILGLPREPDVSRDLPWQEVPHT
jgi:alkylation response protein AidB-like acyl-CoA dehydrogenase